MRINKLNIGNIFLLTALAMLVLGLCFGVMGALTYVLPDFLKNSMGFSMLRPLHVSSALFWIILGATGCVYNSLSFYMNQNLTNNKALLQWGLWIIAITGIFYSYFNRDFGGREYWEFNPVWALPIAFAWLLFIFNFLSIVKKIKQWPVYIWMWFTGIIFFLFTFSENYLWVFPYFRQHFITDFTIQWKVNGSLVGAWNQIIYGTAFFLMDRIENSKNTGRSKLAFLMYFIGLFNLMFNWGHHIYTLPTAEYVRYVGYIVSMTEWIFFIRIIYEWRRNISTIQKNYHYFPYRFLMASEIWVFLNLVQAILMSVPAFNIYTHGTHVTVAHAMGTTIGINSMILFAACFEYLNFDAEVNIGKMKFLNICFWATQIFLLWFWISLNIAGIQKGFWQLQQARGSYSAMMDSLKPYFISFLFSGSGLLISLGSIALVLIQSTYKRSIYYSPSTTNINS